MFGEYLKIHRLCGHLTIKLKQICNRTVGEPIERLKIIICITFLDRIIHEFSSTRSSDRFVKIIPLEGI